MDQEGEKGAIRYLLKTYKNEYQVADDDKELYTSYLLNILCNDEKSLGLTCKIIIHEYSENRVQLDECFYNVIVNKLEYEIKKKHDLEIIWLTYLLRYTDYEMEYDLLKKIFESECELAIIIILAEWKSLVSTEDVDMCWNNATSWILLYQLALNYPEKRELFYNKLSIVHNKGFYEKLFERNFSFYKPQEITEENS